MATLEMCKVEGYAMGTVLRPDPAADPVGAKNWQAQRRLRESPYHE